MLPDCPPSLIDWDTVFGAGVVFGGLLTFLFCYGLGVMAPFLGKKEAP